MGGAQRGAAERTAAVHFHAMANTVLLTHHHRQALVNAAERGFWMPMPLRRSDLDGVLYLSALSRGSGCISQLLEVCSFEPWRSADGAEQWLPFVGQLVTLPRAIPLGNRHLLRGWLPQRREASQILPLDGVLGARRLSDLLAGSGAHCPLPRNLGAGQAISAAVAPDRAA